MPLFRDRFRVESTRVPGWDYSAPSFYFVTICTRNRACNLGDIVNGALVPSLAGQIVTEEWLTTPEVRPNVGLDAWIIMPNHLHGIIVINELLPTVETTRRAVLNPEQPDETTEGLESQTRRPSGSSLQGGSLGAIVGQFKSVCTKRIRREYDSDFAWQTRYYEHIIRDERSLNRIRDYIDANPAKWHEDKENPSNQ